MPKAFNLYEHINSAEFKVGSTKLKPKLHNGWKYDRVDLKCTNPEGRLEMTFNGFKFETKINNTQYELFSGQRVLFTLSRNNDIDWIKDWMRWHHRMHGADGLILADNSSELYSPEELRDALSSVEGFQSVVIVPANFPFGPGLETATNVSDAKFLQVGISNLVLRRFLMNALSVAFIDIDELIIGSGARSIFEAAERSYIGLVVIEGRWRHLSANFDTSKEKPTHSDHLYESVTDKPCPSKICLVPRSIAGRMDVKVHNMRHMKHMPFIRTKDFWFMHCRSITTSWKYNRKKLPSDSLRFSTSTADVLSAGFKR